MTLVDIIAILGCIGTLGTLIMFFVQRKINNRSLSVDILKGTKETEKLEQEIENKYALQVKQWIDDLQEIKEKHDAELDKKEHLIQDLQDARLGLVTELTAVTLKLGQCGRAHRRVFTALGIPYWECDHDGKLIFANGPWLLLFGLSKDEALGEGWLNAIPEADREAIIVSWYSRVIDETDGHIELTIKNAVTGAITKAKAVYAVKFDNHSEVYKIIGATVPLEWEGINWNSIDTA